MFGYGASEVVGMHAVDFTAPESREAVLRHVSTDSPEPYEAVSLRKDGTRRSIRKYGGRGPCIKVEPSG
jgi:hypothetical protein